MRVRLRLEFTTEPFDLEEPPEHAVAAREAIRMAGLDDVDVGPFGNTAEGGPDTVLAAVDTVLRRALDAGATRVTLQVNVVAPALRADPSAAPGESGGSGA
ncbi:hypothetical protein GCM10010387_63850 [Streptomyces inusitatus]|uniref:Thiamine-binding protein domain-containing protein n=1 Tax=Streptomyces inusitatus TaxID=68221 RepID=A0A918QR33_9ACTN|nr:hypothetical protein GCM10010387_63850 [Streptomyces inusitatus]